MTTIDHKSVIAKNTALLIEKIGQSIEAMTGKTCSVTLGLVENDCFSYKGIVVLVPFSGAVQGHYIMTLACTVAAKLLNMPHNPCSTELTEKTCEDCFGFTQEVLNTAAGYAIVDLERVYGDLSYFSPVVVKGEIVFPSVLSATMSITTEYGKIVGAVMLDLVKPKIAQQLSAMLSDLSQKTQEATIDGLTKVHNRAFFETFLRQAITDALRNKTPLSLIMIDVDHFKSLNDNYGHQFGDHILKSIAAEFRNALGESDIAARYGGDEFIITLPNRPPEECAMIAERLRSAMRHLTLEYAAHKTTELVSITLSMGVTSLNPTDSFEELLSRADKLLYCAKRAGRNMFISG